MNIWPITIVYSHIEMQVGLVYKGNDAKRGKVLLMNRKKVRAGCFVQGKRSDMKTRKSRIRSIKTYVKRRGWDLVAVVDGAGQQENSIRNRLKLLHLAKEGEINVVIVWSIDCWTDSLRDFASTVRDLLSRRVRFISVMESIDLDDHSGVAVVRLLEALATLTRQRASARISAGISGARQRGGRHGRPVSAGKKAALVRRLFGRGLSKAEISRRLKIGRTSVRRFLSSMDS
jgi:DNA invertase Pin-like site-specific DNA recombinase